VSAGVRDPRIFEVRATATEVGGEHRIALDVRFPERPSAGELSHALAALSVGCRISAREALVLSADETLAAAYLRQWDDGPATRAA